MTRDSDVTFVNVAMGLVISGVIRIDPEDPKTLATLREATQKVCDALFPKEPNGPRVGFGYPDLANT